MLMPKASAPRGPLYPQPAHFKKGTVYPGGAVQTMEAVMSAKTCTLRGGTKALGVSVYKHCLAAGHAAKKILSPAITSPKIISWLEGEFPGIVKLMPFVAACHDVGKLSPGFQAMIRGMVTTAGGPHDPTYGCLRHEVVTYEHIKYLLGGPLSKILLYHHGGYRNGDKATSIGIDSGDAWETMRNSTVNNLAKEFKIDLATLSVPTTITPPVWKYLAGLVVVSDWIASDENCFSPRGYFSKDVKSLASSALTKYGFYRRDNSWIPGMTFQEVFGIPFPPNPGQVTMASVVDGPGLYIYEAPMGIGKTEAALYPALDLYRKGVVEGVYFAMPTQVTSNRIFTRMETAVTNWFDRSDAHLLHGSADVFHNPAEDDWFKGNKKAILDEFGAGTVDQALLGVLPSVKHFFLRTMGMCHKAVIIDEVHSYDIFTSNLVKALIKDLVDMDCVVIVLTATLTADAKKEILSYV